MFGFFKHRKEMIQFVSEQGGMHNLYKDFIDRFVEDGFNIQEVTKESVYLHHGAPNGKVGVQLVQVSKDEVELLMGCETPTGHNHSARIKVPTTLDQEEMFDRLISKFKST